MGSPSSSAPLLLLSIALLLGSCSVAQGNGATVYGYWPYWTSGYSSGDVSKIPLNLLTHLSLFCIEFNSNGELTEVQRFTSVANTVIAAAHASGVKVDVCLCGFSQSTQVAVLGNPTKRNNLANALGQLVEQYGADGVNIDIEGMPSSQKVNFVSFIQTLRQDSRIDVVFLATPAVDWKGAYDYDQLAANSDGLFIMAYDYHWKGGDPGPVSPLQGGGIWSQSDAQYSIKWTVDDYLANGTPREKIILGLPLYGFRWPTNGGSAGAKATGQASAVLYKNAPGICAADSGSDNFDSVTTTPWCVLSGGSEQLWYDNAASLEDKIQYAMDSDLQGFGFWALTYAGLDPALWNDVVAAQIGSTFEPTPEPSPFVDQPCTGLVSSTSFGTCYDINQSSSQEKCTSSGGVFQVNLCSGPSNIRCCVIPYFGYTCGASNGDEGICLDVNDAATLASECTSKGGNTSPGLCPGPANIQCCLFQDPSFSIEQSCALSNACGLAQTSPGSCGCSPSCTVDNTCCQDACSACNVCTDSADCTPSATSCCNRCGEFSQGASCQCDALCLSFSDCCNDIDSLCPGAAEQSPAPPPSCVGACGGASASGLCFCDDQCTSFDDCCEDYALLCGSPTPSTPACPSAAKSGDVNADGVTNISDIVIIAELIANANGVFDPCVIFAADVVMDGTLTINVRRACDLCEQ